MRPEPSAVPSCQRCDTEVTLAHLSDPHLPPPRLHWKEFLNKRALSLISWKGHRYHHHRPEICAALIRDIARHAVDAVLVSGDLTNFGTDAELSAAAQWLDTLPAQAFAVPGNHDRMVYQPWGKGLRLWEEWTGTQYPYVRKIGRLAVIGVNSAVPTPPFAAFGYVAPSQAHRLETMLDQLEKEGYCRVVMIHHPPRRGLVPWQKSLFGMKRIIKVLQRKGAEIVLHGHSHNATLTTIQDTDIPLLGVASASLFSNNLLRRACWNHIRMHTREECWEIELERRAFDGAVTDRACWKRPRYRKP